MISYWGKIAAIWKKKSSNYKTGFISKGHKLSETCRSHFISRANFIPDILKNMHAPFNVETAKLDKSVHIRQVL